MKKRIVSIASLCGLFIFYYVFRYLLFEWHGMKDFPFYLLIMGIIVIIVSGIIIGNKLAPIFTAAGYTVGFFAGHIFAVDSFDSGGGRQNKMWIIWIILFGTAIIAGVLIDTFCTKHITQ